MFKKDFQTQDFVDNFKNSLRFLNVKCHRAKLSVLGKEKTTNYVPLPKLMIGLFETQF